MKNNIKTQTEKKYLNANHMSLVARGRGYSGMDIFLIDAEGEEHYLMPYRYNMPLYYHLQKEVRISDLRNIKPDRSHYTQKLLHSLNHVIKVAHSYVKYEMDLAA